MIKYNINGITLIVSRLQKFKIGNHYGPNDYIDMQQILRYWNVGQKREKIEKGRVKTFIMDNCLKQKQHNIFFLLPKRPTLPTWLPD